MCSAIKKELLNVKCIKLNTAYESKLLFLHCRRQKTDKILVRTNKFAVKRFTVSILIIMVVIVVVVMQLKLSMGRCP